MIRLYLRAIAAQTPEDIIGVAEDAQNFLIHHPNQCTTQYFTHDMRSLSIFVETNSILSQVSHAKESLSPFDIICSFIGSPFLLICTSTHGPTRFRFATSMFMRSFPWASSIEKVLQRHFELSPESIKIALVGAASLYQTLIECDQNSKSNRSVSSFISTTSSVFIINLFSSYLVKLLEKHFNAVPPYLVHLLVGALITTPLVQHFTKYELSNLAYSIFLAIMNSHQREPVEYEVPGGEPPPNQLKCLICYDLLENPVQCKGHVFCKRCLLQWMNRVQECRHPVTGEIVTNSDIGPEYIFDILSLKYRAYLRDLNSNSK